MNPMIALAPIAALMLAAPVAAETLTGSKAKKQLFAADKSETVLVDPSPLPADQGALLAQVGATQPYYGAIAISPDEGLMVEATVAAANYHSIEAAAAAATADCDSKRKGATACVVVAYIQPKGWKPREVQLSNDATKGFKEGYPRKGGALAVSQLSGAWGVGEGAEAAIAACAAKSPKATDCTVIIAD